MDFCSLTHNDNFLVHICCWRTVSPRAFLPVQLIEGRIAKDLCTNLVAIRNYVSKQELQRGVSQWAAEEKA